MRGVEGDDYLEVLTTASGCGASSSCSCSCARSEGVAVGPGVDFGGRVVLVGGVLLHFR